MSVRRREDCEGAVHDPARGSIPVPQPPGSTVHSQIGLLIFTPLSQQKALTKGVFILTKASTHLEICSLTDKMFRRECGSKLTCLRPRLTQILRLLSVGSVLGDRIHPLEKETVLKKG